MDGLGQGSQVSTMGARLRAIRERGRMSQVEFAELLGVSRGALINWEKDESEPPTSVLKLMRGHFDVDPEWLLNGDDLLPRRIFAIHNWPIYDRIEAELQAACHEARLELSPDQLRDLTRIIYEDGTEAENLGKGKVLKTLRVMARER